MNNNKTIKEELESYMLFDKLSALAIEYSTTADHLANISMQRFVDDVEFFRGLRRGAIESAESAHTSILPTIAPNPNEQT